MEYLSKKCRYYFCVVSLFLCLTGCKKEDFPSNIKNSDSISTSEKTTYNSKESSEISETVKTSSEVEPDDYTFGKVHLLKEDVNFSAQKFMVSEQPSYTHKVDVSLTSNVHELRTSTKTTPFHITTANLKIIDENGTELAGGNGNIQVMAGNGMDTAIISKDIVDETTNVNFIPYHFSIPDSNKIKVEFVDDDGKVMYSSDWIEQESTDLSKVFPEYAQFEAYIAGSGKQPDNTIPKYLDPVNFTDVPMQHVMTFYHAAKNKGGTYRFLYGLGTDGKIYSMNCAEGTLESSWVWAYEEEMTAEALNFDYTPWEWPPGVQEEVIQSCIDNRYIEDGKYYISPKYIHDGEGYYGIYIEYEGYLVQVVYVNCKTGVYHG